VALTLFSSTKRALLPVVTVQRAVGRTIYA
jgi:hypothetical protein